MSQHDQPSLRARLMSRIHRAEVRSVSLEEAERGCVKPGNDPRSQSGGFFTPLV
jgi:hypothetical protein